MRALGQAEDTAISGWISTGEDELGWRKQAFSEGDAEGGWATLLGESMRGPAGWQQGREPGGEVQQEEGRAQAHGHVQRGQPPAQTHQATAMYGGQPGDDQIIHTLQDQALYLTRLVNPTEDNVGAGRA